MNIPTLAICSPSFCRNEKLRTSALATFSSTHRVKIHEGDEELTVPALALFLEEAEFAIVGKEKVTSSLLSQLPYLRAIAKYGVGMDNIDLNACAKTGVRVLWKEGVNADSVAEHTLALMLAVMRNIGRSDRHFHNGVWWKNGGRQLTGKTIGIVGYGHIGSRVANLLQAFRCRTLVNEIDDGKREVIRAQGFQRLDLDELIERSDIVSLHVPLDSSTHWLINERNLRNFSPQAVLVNTSRGKVVDQKALKLALQTKRLAGAGLDVFEEEPVTDPEFWNLDTLVATAHMAGNSLEAVLAMGQAAIACLADFHKG